MVLATLTKLYPFRAQLFGNFKSEISLLQQDVAKLCGNSFSLLRGRLGCLAFDAIPERFSSSLPSLFASGRFVTFLSFGR